MATAETWADAARDVMRTGPDPLGTRCHRARRPGETLHDCLLRLTTCEVKSPNAETRPRESGYARWRERMHEEMRQAGVSMGLNAWKHARKKTLASAGA